MNNFQAMINGLSQHWQSERAENQLTLGKLIDALEAMPRGAQVANLHTPKSYRGYYDDLAFSLGNGTRPVKDLLADCRAAMGEVFTGYKGGEYVMGRNTPLWIADYGKLGVKLVAVEAGGDYNVSEEGL